MKRDLQSARLRTPSRSRQIIVFTRTLKHTIAALRPKAGLHDSPIVGQRTMRLWAELCSNRGLDPTIRPYNSQGHFVIVNARAWDRLHREANPRWRE